MKKKLLFPSGLALLMCLFLFAGGLSAQTETVSVEFVNTASPTTWSLPTDVTVTSVTIEAIGGGGGGGSVDGYNSSLFRSGGGGSGAAYAKRTLTTFTQGQSFTITVGAGGVNTPTWEGNALDIAHISGHYNYSYTNGGPSLVVSNGTTLVKAAGGLTVSGRNNMSGANALDLSQSIGELVHIGGNGSSAYASNEAEWQVTSAGSGGGAGGSTSNGGNGVTSINLDGNNQGGAAGGGRAGAGGKGQGTWNSTPTSENGHNYGGGGSGAWCTGVNWAYTGGRGGNGIVVITYTYLNTPTQSVSIANASANVCSGGDFDVALNITADGFDMNQAVVVTDMLGSWDLSISGGGASYNPLDEKWHVTGSITNFTSSTVQYSIGVTVTTPDGTANATATVTLTIYPELNGGLIAEDQLVCHDLSIQLLNSVQDATGGSGNGSYQWVRWDEVVVTNAGEIDWGAMEWTEIVDNADESTYLPTLQGTYYYARGFVDPVCGTAYALVYGETERDYLQVTTVDPISFSEDYSAEDTICSNESYSRDLGLSFESPVVPTYEYYSDLELTWKIYWQQSTDKGNSWTNLTGLVWEIYHVNLTPSDFSAGDDIWYRAAIKINDCDSVPSNAIYKIHVKEIPSYAGQFPDINITLWYGACDTSIAELVPPVLTPTPASITRVDNYGDRLTPNEYVLTWSVIADDCNIPVEYTQNVTVEYPVCGTLDEPYVITDVQGNEYQTIRIGCECWLAENLRTSTTDATYYDDDPANERFGMLYTWEDAVGSNNEEMATMAGGTYIQGVCPKDWAMPTVAQYNKMMEVAGTAEDIKSDDENDWMPDLVGTNTVGFAAMGAGYFSGMQYQRLLGYTDFWTADDNESNSTVAKAMELRPGCDELLNVDKNKADKLSVRCVRVETVPSTTDCGTVTVDGVEYETVIIGSQCWTKRNLRSTKAADGTDITGTTLGHSSKTEPYYYCPTNGHFPDIPVEERGYLYNWPAANVVCPTGWHLPSDAEWTTMEQNLTTADLSATGYRGDHAAKLAGSDYWHTSTNANAPGNYDNAERNATGFTAVPAGYCSGGSAGQATYMTKFWSSTENENNPNYAWYRQLYYGNAGVMRHTTEASGKQYGHSVRCVKD
jgi:uncharacterized protein (TIGR02145 family)